MAACLHALHDTLPSSFILDGELVIQNQQGALLPFREVSVMLGKEEKQLKEGSSVRLCIFDLLFLEHQDLTLKPLAERKRLLQQYFPSDASRGFVLVPFQVIPFSSNTLKPSNNTLHSSTSSLPSSSNTPHSSTSSLPSSSNTPHSSHNNTLLTHLIEESVREGCEGLVLKNMNSVYACGARNSTRNATR